MSTPYLIADSAQVTVLRSLASTAFGKYGLSLPEGVDLEDLYEVAAPGSELAYVSSLGSRRVGGMFRRFVRADVSVTAQGEDMVPASDVERVLDEAAKRVSGDFFLESDISKAGLGPWEPMVDFQVGDIVNVEIWGRVVPLAVTRIEPKRTEHSDMDWAVHVGGQLLSDADARLAQNAEIYSAVVSDRRELAGLDGKIRAETSNRKAAIASESRRSDAYVDALVSDMSVWVNESFQESYERYSEALSELGDAWRQELQSGLSAEQQARVEALRLEQEAREQAGTDLRGQLERQINSASSYMSEQLAGERSARQTAISAEAQARALGDSNEARARQKAISDLSQSFSTELEVYGRLIDEAGNSTDEATKKVVAFWSEENQNRFNQAVQLTLAAQNAYNDVNNIKWVSQDAWNEQQQKINDAAAKFQAQQLEINDQNEAFRKLTEELDAQQTEQIVQLIAVQKQIADESQGRIREIMATPAGTSDPRIPVEKRNDGEPGWQITLTDMVGGSVFNVQWHAITGTAPSGATEIKQTYSIVRTLDSNSSSYNLTSTPNHAFVFARWASVSKRQVTVDKSADSSAIPRRTWQSIMTYPAPTRTARQATLRLKVTWAAATYDDMYGIRIRAGDRTLREYMMTKLGPLTFLGDGEKWMSTTVSNQVLQPGETISAEVYTSALTADARRMKSAQLTGTWIEEV